MPTYEYVCQKCGHAFEKSQSIADKPLTICPKDLCGKAKWGKGRLKKLISAGVGLLFKGSGFYITDYRSDKYKEAAKKDVAPVAAAGDGKSGAAASGDSKSGSSGDSKSSSGGDSKSGSGGDSKSGSSGGSKSGSDRDRSSSSGGRGQTKPSSAKVESKPAKGGKSGS